MSVLLENIHLALPEIILLSTACLTLIADLFFRQHCSNIAFICAIFGLITAGIVNFLFLGSFTTTILNGLFISDNLAQLMKIFIYLAVLLCFIYSRSYIQARGIPSGDYYVLGLFSTLGMIVLVSGGSLLTIYLGMELLSLPLYAMTAIRRTDSDASEAGMKYFIMGAIASAMLLYGFSLLYGATGKLDLLEIANYLLVNEHQHSTLLSIALVFIIAGLGFKLAATPFHMWVPDVYQGAPSSVTLFISAAPKIAAIGMALRLLHLGLIDLSSQWQQLLLLMSLLSVAVGNILAVIQTNIKRLFAYSAISHMGYALFGILAADNAGLAAALYYVLIYSVMTVAAFGLIVILSCRGIEIENINDLKGLNKKNPWIAFMLLIVMFSMAGVPPTVGFFAKLLVLQALIVNHMTWVAVLGLFFAVIGAYYYVLIVKIMYFEESKKDFIVQLSKPIVVIFSLNCLSLLYLGIFPSALITACTNALLDLGHTSF